MQKKSTPIKAMLVPQLNRAPLSSIVPEVPRQTGIPRIIHQTFYSKQLPDALQQNVERLKAMNPGWDYRFYDDAAVEEFISSHYPPIILDYFRRISPRYGAARADLFRYLLTHKLGGVYLDIKSTATKPLDEVFLPDDSFLLSEWNTDIDAFKSWGQHYELGEFGGREFQQWFIACSPGHPFLRSVIENVLRNIDTYIPGLHGTGKPGVLRVTGPIAYSLAIHRLLDMHPHRMVDSRKELGFEYSVLAVNSHKTEFKSHYSLQTESLIRLDSIKKVTTHFYRFAQKLHDLRVRRNAPANGN